MMSYSAKTAVTQHCGAHGGDKGIRGQGASQGTHVWTRLTLRPLSSRAGSTCGFLPGSGRARHLPSLQLAPLLVSFGIWEPAGDRITQLRDLTHADDPTLMQPPAVEEFSTEQLGPGLKVLAYTQNKSVITGTRACRRMGSLGTRRDLTRSQVRLLTGGVGARSGTHGNGGV
jgi:hypothetical protein